MRHRVLAFPALLALVTLAGCAASEPRRGPAGSNEGGEGGGSDEGGRAGGGSGTGGSGGSGSVDAARPSGGTRLDAAGATGGQGGEDPTPPTADAAAPARDSAEPPTGGDAAAPACGMAGQACCAGNMCTGGATPQMTPGSTGDGMMVMELKARNSDPYKQVAEKMLLPIDGPDSGYIFDDGTSFLFVLHQNGAEEIVSSGAQRQRNEVTVNPGNPAIYKGTKGSTMSYTWRFRLEKMNANPTWCDIFQIKQHGPLGVAPYMAFEANKDELTIDTEKMGVVRRIPLSMIMNVWINARVTIKFDDAGSLNFSLMKDDGTEVLSYSNNNFDMWDTTVDFVRPKWGLYRNKRDGAGEAAIRYNEMRIFRGTAGTAATCSCR